MDRWIRLPRNRERDNTIIKPQPIRTCQWPRKRCGWECRRSEREWINFIDFPQPLFTTLCGWLDQKLGQELKVPYWEYPPIIVRFNCYPCWLFVGQPMGPSFLPRALQFDLGQWWSGQGKWSNTWTIVAIDFIYLFTTGAAVPCCGGGQWTGITLTATSTQF